MKFKKEYLFIGTTIAGLGIVFSCGSGGNVISNSAQLQSTLLIDANNFSTAAVADCAVSATSCTPSSFSGRVYAAGIMLESSTGGADGGFSMTFLAASEDIINRPDEGKTGTLTFDLGAPAKFSGLMAIPSEESMPPSAVMSGVDLAPDYMDATFTFTGHTDATTFNKQWTVRTIFVNTDTIGGLVVTGGDLLLKEGADGDWKWCDTSGCSTTRPTTPYQLSSVAQRLAQVSASDDGNPNYAYYSVDFSETIPVTFGEISDTTRLWTLDFDIEGAVQWTVAPSTFVAPKDILANFKLPYACNGRDCEAAADPIEVTLTIGAAGSATAATK